MKQAKPTHIENNNGGINKVVQHPIPQRLTTIPSIELEQVIGRKNDLKAITQLLNHASKVVLVNGLGGIGKTTLAQAWLQQFQQEFTHIAWVNILHHSKEAFVFNTDLSENLYLDLKTIPKDEHFIDKAFELIINRLRQLEGNNLLILDNAQSDVAEQAILQQISLGANWKTLVTSRENLEGFETYELGFLSLEEAMSLFYLHYTIAKNDALVQQIVAAVDRHTLAVEVMAKTAQAQQMRLSELLKQIEKSGLQFLEYEENEAAYIQFPRGYNQRMRKVFTFLTDIFDLAALTKYEQWLLMQFSVLPSIFIPYQEHEGENMLAFLQIQEGQERTKFTDAINQVVAKGWLLWDKTADRFRLHQVLQEVVRAKLSPQLGSCLKLTESIKQKLKQVVTVDPFKQLSLFKKYGESLILNFQDNSTLLAALINNLSVLLRYQGHYQKSLNLEFKALSILEATTPPNHLDFATVFQNIAIIYQYLGDIKQGIEYANKAIEIKKIYDNQEIELAISLSHLSSLQRENSDITASLGTQKKAIAIYEKNINHLQHHLATAYNGLSLIYKDQGDFKHALLYQEKVIEIYEKVLPPYHTHLSTAYVNISNLYRNNKKYEKAIKYLTKSLAIDNKNLGTSHPYLVSSYNNLALIYRDLGKYEQALKTQEKAFDIASKNYPTEHTETATLYHTISTIYQFMGDLNAALSYEIKTLQIEQVILKDKHFSLAITYYHLALIYYKLKDLSAAKNYIDQSILILKFNFPNGHPSEKNLIRLQNLINQL